MNPPMLKVNRLQKTYESNGNTVEVLRGITFQLKAGASLSITGPSGSGKSTLLHILGTLDTPSAGAVQIDGKNPFELPEADLARFRNEFVGFIFQDHHLMPQFSVIENVLMPTLAFSGRGDGLQRSHELLKKVGLEHRMEHRPAQLSGGERQRVAVARALINRPKLLLCDEPTGSLDKATADSVSDLLFELHEDQGTVLVVVTHSLDLAGRFARRYELRGGQCSRA